MNKKRSIFEDLHLNEETEKSSPLDIDVKSVKLKVNNSIFSANTERKAPIMKKKRTAFVALAATLLLGVTVFASGGLATGWLSHSSATPDYKSLPTASEVEKEIGYEPVLIDTFENGYKFANGSIVSNTLTNENGVGIEKFKSISFKYEKGKDKVYFSQDKYTSQTVSEGKDPVAAFDGTDIYFTGYTNKLVPPDYELTEEDKLAQENGELVFSYGSSKVEITEVTSVTWEKDGIKYNLMQLDGELSEADLIEMAKEAIKY